MGKKVMKEASLKIPHKHDKNKLNSLIKVLRPKVYITDSSSFKKLVQELTGNRTPVTPPSRPPPPPPAITLGSAAEKFPVIEIGGGDSRETSACSSPEEAYNLLQPSFIEEARQVMDMTALDDFLMNQVEADGLGFEEMGSWFLEMDPFSASESFEEAACIYDYDLTGLV